MQTTSEVIYELKVYLKQKYQGETAPNKELIMQFLEGLDYIELLINRYDQLKIALTIFMS
jgi:hypothetical protein